MPFVKHWRQLSKVVLCCMSVTLMLLSLRVINTSSITPILNLRGNIKVHDSVDMVEFKLKVYTSDIEHTCQRMKNEDYVISINDTEHKTSLKGIVDHYHRVVYCDIGKTGTSSWLALFQKLAKREHTPRSRWFKQHKYPWYSRKMPDRYPSLHKVAFNRLSRGREAHREVKDGLPDPRTDYFKFIVVRHPLERLASAYYSRVADHLKKEPIVHIKKIVSQNTPGGFNKSEGVTFEEFLTYLKTPDYEMHEAVDNHWKTYQSLCEPCSIQYDYVARLETLESDLKHLLPKLQAEDLIDSFPDKNAGKVGSEKYRDMYLNVPFSVLKPVLDKYQADADMFGYTFDDYISK